MCSVPPGVVPPYGDAFLTFVPDFGGWNNVRMALENAVVLAREFVKYRAKG